MCQSQTEEVTKIEHNQTHEIAAITSEETEYVNSEYTEPENSEPVNNEPEIFQSFENAENESDMFAEENLGSEIAETENLESQSIGSEIPEEKIFEQVSVEPYFAAEQPKSLDLSLAYLEEQLSRSQTPTVFFNKNS